MDKESLEIVGSGKPTGFRHDINKRGEKLHSQIHLQILSCSRMREMRRESEVPEEKVPVAECLDGPARITSKELAPIHSVKKWHPPVCLL